jgi:hypothetical protein
MSESHLIDDTLPYYGLFGQVLTCGGFGGKAFWSNGGGFGVASVTNLDGSITITGTPQNPIISVTGFNGGNASVSLGNISGPIVTQPYSIDANRIGKNTVLNFGALNTAGNNTSAVISFSGVIPGQYLPATTGIYIFPVTCISAGNHVAGAVVVDGGTGVLSVGLGVDGSVPYAASLLNTGWFGFTISWGSS